MIQRSPGKQFRLAVENEQPLQVVGCINAYSALQAENAGYRALYLSGSGVACASYGHPDLGMTGLSDVLIDARRITERVNLPLLVDVDTGWGSALNISRTVKEMINARVAAIHIEDQVNAKRCGHRPNKALVPLNEMVDRIKTAVDARTDNDFVIMARTDAFAQEGMSGVIDRANAYIEAGADMLFPEAITKLYQFQEISNVIRVPILANLTEFGQTPLFTLDELKEVKVAIALYPLSAFRAMSRSAELVYQTIRHDGTQKNLIEQMQTRDQLYETLEYYKYEMIIDKLNANERGNNNDS